MRTTSVNTFSEISGEITCVGSALLAVYFDAYHAVSTDADTFIEVDVDLELETPVYREVRKLQDGILRVAANAND